MYKVKEGYKMTSEELHLYLTNPENVGENRVPAHSDHFFYENERDVALKDEMPLKQSLCGEWKFKYSKNLYERPENFYEEKYDISKFDTILVPGHIELQGYGIPQYTNVAYPWDGTEALKAPNVSREDNPVGSYACDVKINKNLKGKPLFISFQGVQTAFRLFINGKYVGYGEDSFTPTEFEITDFVHDGKNRIAVEVYKHSSASWLEDQDMWRLFGIFREVYLYAIPALHVEDMCVKALLDSDYEKGVLYLDAKVRGRVAYASLEMYDMENKKVFEAPISNEYGKLSLHMEGLVIKPWSAEEPNLYELRVILKNAGGNISEIAVTRIGFRTFELKNKVMLLNGKRIIFKGVDRHEFSALNGRAVSKEEMLWDIKTFKKNNINAVRTSHYPNQSMWYRLCDEYGIYMIDETNLETHGTWGYGSKTLEGCEIPGSKPEWKKAVLDRANNMLMRDRNHAAVLIWSLGNESYGGTNFIEMHDFLKDSDDTRLVHYEGVFHCPEFKAASDIETQMYTKPQDVRKYLSENPEKPFINCEYMHAMGNSLGGMKLYTDLEDEFEMYQGGFIWDFLDQSLWQKKGDSYRLAYGGDFGDRPCNYCFSTDGIVFGNRKESPKCIEAKHLYSNVRVDVSEDSFTVENRNLFIDLSRYYFTVEILKNGNVVYEENRGDINVMPGEKRTYGYGYTEGREESSDYVIRVRMREKEATKWADEGYTVVTFEKTVFAKVNPFLKAPVEKTFRHVAMGRENNGVVTENMSAMFEKGNHSLIGGMVSLKNNGVEYVTLPPKPTFFRANTDNDKGFKFGPKTAYFDMLSRYSLCDFVSFEEKDGAYEALYNYHDPADDSVVASLKYTLNPDDRIFVSAKYYGKENRPMLPLFGFEMKLNKGLNNVEYFGKGPVENYRDRNNGVHTDIYKTTVDANLTPYLIPQEVGNRTGVRYAKVTDNEGHGLKFTALDDTFEFGFLPFSAYEMENAEHLDELPARNYTWIRILAGQMGVGGDDTWGAPVHEEFRLDSSKDLEVNFEISFI